MDNSLWTQLAPVITGGVIGLAGGLVAAVVPELLRTRSARKALEAGIVAEVESLVAIVERRQYIEGMRKELAKAEAEPDPEMAHCFSFGIAHDPFAVFDANVTRLACFGHCHRA